MTQQIDFNDVIPKAQAGDLKAHNELMAAMYAWSISIVRRVIRDSETAKDVAIEFWAWLRDGGIKQLGAPTAFWDWADLCLTRRAIEANKRPRVDIDYRDDMSWHDTAQTVPDLLQAGDEVDEIMRRFQGTEREILSLLVEGATVKDIAVRFSISLSRARNLIGKIRNQIEGII
jgi:DNA-directed RNA polymerase specialized sigma24 family protein